MMQNGKILGVTGGIASGKSLVSGLLAKAGWSVLSADQVARRVVRPGSSLLSRLVRVFGEQILTSEKTLDRTRLGEIVFNDSDARLQLNALMHPAIAEASEKQLETMRDTGHHLIVYEAPLLFEAGARARVDEVLTVLVSRAIQVERLCLRDGISRDAAVAKIDSHWPQHRKVALSDYVIDNSGSIDETRRQVDALNRYLTSPLSVPG